MNTHASSPASASKARPGRAGRYGFRLLGLAIALVLLDALVGMVLGRLYPTVGRGQLTGMANSAVAARADVLILGASTARHHFDDRALGERLGVRTFNTGLDGRGIVFSRGLLALVQAAHAPRLVVLDVSYSDRDRSSARLLAPFYGRNAVINEVLAWNWRERLKLMSRAYRYNGLLLPILANRDTPPIASGFEPLEGALADTTRWRGPSRGGRGFGPWYGDELRKLVNQARAHGSRMLFVESPTWGGLVAKPALDEYERVAAEMGVPYVHLTPDRVAELNHASLYYDRTHLNARGAAIFTALLEPVLRAELEAARP